ncbi:MFS transporter [Terribacillus saccharophilus]|uniref:Major facilitator superfamily (MFS) profile domain-containing protein n=1 Tax=Terribacillus saccharophilus TaxID=361277 RepID=A0A268AB31_9BACI|nr:MFS transporter [Terribacillus saccharophilus]PAD21333.1 hypothetical protein CHH64_09345 [Terribacillus saccharophilus]
MKSKKKTLFSNRVFLNFWIGQTVSMFGSQISIMALPLTAVLIFDASTMEMGIYQAVASAPYLIIGLFAGVWIDRVRRRPLVIYSNLATGIILSLVPLLAWLGLLNMTFMYIILFLFGTSTLIFELSFLSFIPNIVDKKDLTEANSKLQSSRSVSRIIGPNLAGPLISIFTAPFAILIDSFSFLISFLFLRSIPVEENAKKKQSFRRIWSEIGIGLKTIFNNPILISLSASTATINFFHTTFAAIFMIFLVKQIGLTPLQIGLVMGISSSGTLLGAFVARKLSVNLGIGTTIIGATSSIVIGTFVIAISPNSLLVALPMITIGQFLSGLGNTIYVINQVSLRQTITPDEILGKVNASSQFLSRGAMPFAGIFGGSIGSWFGLKIALLITAIGFLLSVVWLLLSPLKAIKTVDDALDEQKKLKMAID